MDEISVFRRIADTVEDVPTGLGDLRGSIWKAIVNEPLESVLEEDFFESTYFSRAVKYVDIAAIALFTVGIALSIDSIGGYLSSTTAFSSYYNLLDSAVGGF